MLKKNIITLMMLIFFTVSGFTAAAENGSPVCSRLNEKASGEALKYSLEAEANGALYFQGISCAIEFRNRELCAMEMVSFDTTGKVYDFYTAEKIDIAKAYFWLDDKNEYIPILAFSTKESAEKYNAQTKGGVILDYSGLTDKLLK